MSEMLEREIHILDYLKVVQKRLWIVVAFFVVTVSLTIMSISKQRPYYQASARLQIERETPNVINVQEVVRPDQGFYGDEFFQTQVKLLQSRSLALEVATRLGLGRKGAATPAPPRAPSGFLEGLKSIVGIGSRRGASPTPSPADSAAQGDQFNSMLIDTVLGMIAINPVKNTQLVDVVSTSGEPRLAADVANTLAVTFIERSQNQRLTTTREASSWLTSQLEEARKKVEIAEMALQRYKEEHDIIAPESRESLVVQKLDELNTALTRAKMDRIALETRFRQMEKLTLGSDLMDTFPGVIDNPMVQQLRRDYFQLQNELSDLTKTYTPKHPKIIALKSQIDSMGERVRAEVDKVRQSVRNEYEVAQAREKSLQEALEQQKRVSQGLSQKYIQYSVLDREVENNRRIYDVLLNRAKETGLVEGLHTGNIRIIDRAEVPRGPSGPNLSRSLAMSILFGLLGGIGLAFFFEYLDDSIKDPDDLEKHVQLPFLAPIPIIKPKNKSTLPEMIAFKESKAPSAEGYRSARTSIIFSSPDAPPGAILVTSSGPEEGKTTTAVNLAITMANAGKKVLLVDADLRKPRLHQVFGLKNDLGLSNLLTERTDVTAAVHQTAIAKLSLITSGPIPPNPAELLGSQRMRNLIATLRTGFEFIIFDCPPVISVTDASVLASTVDGIVLVVKAGKTSHRIVNRAKKRLEDVRGKILGVILNSVNVHRSRYYYSPHYYYSYYGEERKKGKKHSA